MVVQTWAFGRHFHKNEQSESVTSRKAFTADDKFPTWELPWYFQAFVMRLMMIEVNVIFGYWIFKWVNI